jgi:hypothetical protein
MGFGSTDNSMISRTGWVLALWISSVLERAEREAVVGDLAESGESGVRVLVNVFGLVIRRQAAVWKDSHLWAVLFILVIPFSFMLCTVAQGVAGVSAVYTWMYANNWDWGLLKSFGFWYVLGDAAMQLSLDCLMVVCWSWSAGLLLGCIRKAVQPTTRGALLLLLPLLQVVNAPQHWFHFWMILSGAPPMPAGDPNAPVTAIAFYRVIFPFIFLGIFVALPAIFGMRQPAVSAPRRFRRVLILGASVSVVTMLFRVLPGFGLLLFASGRQWLWQHRDTMRLIPIFAYFTYWPVLYMLALGVRGFRRRRSALA